MQLSWSFCFRLHTVSLISFKVGSYYFWANMKLGKNEGTNILTIDWPWAVEVCIPRGLKFVIPLYPLQIRRKNNVHVNVTRDHRNSFFFYSRREKKWNKFLGILKCYRRLFLGLQFETTAGLWERPKQLNGGLIASNAT